MVIFKMNTEKPLIVRFQPYQAYEVYQLLINTFRVDEPMCKYTKLTIEECSGAFSDYVQHSLSHGVSFVALDPISLKVVGCRLNTIVDRNFPSISLDFYALYPAKEADLLTFLQQLCEPIDQLPLTVEKILRFDVLCVMEQHRGKGVAKALVDASVSLGKELSLNAIITTATSIKTQRLFDKIGFATLKTIAFEDYRDSVGNRIFFNVPIEESMAKLMIKYL